MQSPLLISQLIVLGIYIYAAIAHGLIYLRLRTYVVHGVFALLCVWIAAYEVTNVVALFFVTNLEQFVLVSRLSSFFVIFIFIFMPWFVLKYLRYPKGISIQLAIALLLPFFVLNLFMENGILWSSIDGIESSAEHVGGAVYQPVDPVISWPMYGLWMVLIAIFIMIVRATYLSLRISKARSDLVLFFSLVFLMFGLINDFLIDMGPFKSSIYLSEYLSIAFVLAMSLQLSDEMYRHKQELESLVAERTERLLDANREMESFSYSISHDLRAPLRAIGGFAKILKEDAEDKLDVEDQELLQRIVANVMHMDSMINGMLRLARLSRQEIQRQEIDLTEMAKEVSEEQARECPDRNVSVLIDEDLKVDADPDLVRILLFNLFDNAWKFTSTVEKPSITMRANNLDSRKNAFVFSDNGIGFNQAQADKIFTPFQRLHKDEEYPGLGIGLATISRIIRRHNGDIRAEGTEGKGATFYVWLGKY
jgi:signal transduction histidine kinase